MNPEEKINIFSDRLVQLNTEYTNPEANVRRKQAAFDSVKRYDGSRTGLHPRRAAENADRKLDEAQRKFAGLKTHYGTNHKECRKGSLRLPNWRLWSLPRKHRAAGGDGSASAIVKRMLRKAVPETKAESDGLNARSFEYQSLKREAETDRSSMKTGPQDQGGKN